MTEVRAGMRVRLRPRPGRDAWDGLLAGRTGVVQRIEEDTEGARQVVVALPGAPERFPFFFGPDEVEPAPARVLVAGIGNVFLGDDGFGCAVAAQLGGVELPDGVDVCDFGIRGLDLAYALQDYDAAILVDATPLGEPPGTLAVIEPEVDEDEVAVETHGMSPELVLRLARGLGRVPGRTLVVGCEPAFVADPDADELVGELSEPLRGRVAAAAELVRSLLPELVESRGGAPS